MIDLPKPELRHPEIIQRIAWRDFIRKHVPPGREGYVAEDLDLVMRCYAAGDPIGKFMLVEFKYDKFGLDHSQRRTFGLIDGLLKKADPERRRYRGYYLLQYPEQDFNKCDHVNVNGRLLTKNELVKFLKFELDVLPYDFGGVSQ